jgi:NitT/TauT family transport system permease protein
VNVPAQRVWAAVWPKLAAIGVLFGFWQIVVWSGWRGSDVLPGPLSVLERLGADLSQPDFYAGGAVTLRRALAGYAIAVVLGGALGLLVARVQFMRQAIGATLVGFQSMPSIAWLPLAILLFQPSETAIVFVVVIGAAPAIASGLLIGVDHVQPLLLRVGWMMGARGLRLYRHIVLPAALPAFVGGLKQGWAFAWRSLMAGELIVMVTRQPSLGQQLSLARQMSDPAQMLALMMMIFAIGVLVDGIFGIVDRAISRRWGLLA